MDSKYSEQSSLHNGIKHHPSWAKTIDIDYINTIRVAYSHRSTHIYIYGENLESILLSTTSLIISP